MGGGSFMILVEFSLSLNAVISRPCSFEIPFGFGSQHLFTFVSRADILNCHKYLETQGPDTAFSSEPKAYATIQYDKDR